MVFSDRYAPEFDVTSLGSVAPGTTAKYRLTDIVSDADNQDAAIVVTAETTGSIKANIAEGYLYVEGTSEGEGSLTLVANSNGRKASTTIQYNATSLSDVAAAALEVTASAQGISVCSPVAGEVSVIDAQGRLVATATVEAGITTCVADQVAAGVYVVRQGANSAKVIVK